MADGAIIITLPADMDPATRDDVLEALDLSGADLDIQTAAGASDANVADQIETQLQSVATAAENLPRMLGEWWGQLAAANDGSPLLGLALVALVLLGAYALERVVMAVAGRWFKPDAAPDAAFSVRLRGALKWLAGRALSLFLFYVFARTGGHAFLPHSPAMALPMGAVGWAIFQARVFWNVFEFLSGSLDPRRRMVPLSEEDGAFIRRATTAVLTMAAIATAAANFFSTAGAAGRLPVLVIVLILLITGFS